LKSARKLRRFSKLRRPKGKNLIDLEKEVFLSFYIIRKLREANKLSDEVVKLKLNILSYPAKGKAVTHYNWHRLDELFDLNNNKQESYDVGCICNRVIHSFIFAPILNNQERITAIFSLLTENATNTYMKSRWLRS